MVNGDNSQSNDESFEKTGGFVKTVVKVLTDLVNLVMARDSQVQSLKARPFVMRRTTHFVSFCQGG
jgi:hypothetical protein